MKYRLPLAATVAAVALTLSGPSYAASDLAAELKQLARTQQGQPSAALRAVSYEDAVYLLDELNHADYRRLAQAMASGQLSLPTSIRHALELKAPRLNQRGSGR